MKPFYCLILLSFLLCSCNHYYYLPNDGQMLMLQEEGDIKTSVGISDKIFVVQAGYSPIKHLAVTGTFFNHNNTNFSNSSFISTTAITPTPSSIGDSRRNGFLASGSVGTYYFLNANKPPRTSKLFKDELLRTKGWLFDLHAGYASGKINNEYSSSGNSKFTFQKYFIQPGIHWQAKSLSISYVLKYSHLNFFKGTAFGNILEPDLQDIFLIEDQNPYNLIEPTFRFQYGTKFLIFYASLTGVSILNDKNLTYKFSQSSLGVTIDIDEFLKPKLSKKTEGRKKKKKRKKKTR